MTPQPLSWLVVTTVAAPDGGERALFGRASYDGQADLLTITTLTPTSRPKEITQGGGSDLQALAKTLLREMYRDGRIKQ